MHKPRAKLLYRFTDIGGTLRSRRKELGKTIADVAATAGVPPSTLQRIESGRTSPTWHLVVAFAQCLDLEPALIPRERIQACEAVVAMMSDDNVPPLLGDHW